MKSIKSQKLKYWLAVLANKCIFKSIHSNGIITDSWINNAGYSYNLNPTVYCSTPNADFEQCKVNTLTHSQDLRLSDDYKIKAFSNNTKWKVYTHAARARNI